TRGASGDKGTARPSSAPLPSPGTGSQPAPSRRASRDMNSDEVDTADRRPRPPRPASIPPADHGPPPAPVVAPAAVNVEPMIAEADVVEAEPPKTDPEPLAHKAAVEAAPDSAPPSIPSAAAAPLDTGTRGGIPVLPGHVIANRYEVLG